MFLKTVRKKFYKELAIVGAILTGLVAVIYHMFIPERYFLWFPAIPVYFGLNGVFHIELVSLYYRMGVDKLVFCYLICKVMKLLGSACFMTFYAVVIGHEITAFMATFVIFFFTFLVFETKFFVCFELKLKERKNNKHENNTLFNTLSASTDKLERNEGSSC